MPSPLSAVSMTSDLSCFSSYRAPASSMEMLSLREQSHFCTSLVSGPKLLCHLEDGNLRQVFSTVQCALLKESIMAQQQSSRALAKRKI